MLIEVKKLVRQYTSMSLVSIAKALAIEPDLARQLLRHWVSKGDIRCTPLEPACGTRCFKCDTLQTEMYQWVGA